MMVPYKRLSLAIMLLRIGVNQALEGVFRPPNVQEGIVALTSKTFDNAIHDIANPLWLIEFHAPWCGLCQHFAGTLELVANAVHGRMAVGTVDCTVEKALCKQRFQIRGYPTLMYAHYGRVEDSPLQHDRSVDDFVNFALRMTSPSLSVVQSMEEASSFTREQGLDGVAFVAYYPGVSLVDTTIGMTGFLDTFQEASKRLQRYSSFAVLQHVTNDGVQLSEGPFICRLEEAVPIRCYDGKSEAIELDPLLDWINRERMPTVSNLTAIGLEDLGRKGRVLCVATYRDPNDGLMARQILKEYATTVAPSIREKYFYGIIDALEYEAFLHHLGFDASRKNPQIFLTNLMTQEYWQNASYELNVSSFLNDVEKGVIPSQSKRKRNQGRKSHWVQLRDAFRNNRPWSYLLVLGQCIFFLAFLGHFIEVRKSLRPPYPRRTGAACVTAKRTPFAPNTASKKKQ